MAPGLGNGGGGEGMEGCGHPLRGEREGHGERKGGGTRRQHFGM